MFCLRRTCLILLAAVTTLTAADYHVAADGDDARDGLTAATAWRTLGRIPMEALGSGDRIVLRAGDRFAGHLRVVRGGNERQPLIITSSGAAPAVIASPAGVDGVFIGASHVQVSGVELVGPGAVVGGAGEGVHLRADEANQRVVGVVLRDLRISGFPGQGIRVSADAAGAGIDDLLVERCDASANGEGGMGSWGPCTVGVWAHRRITVRECRFHDNRGLPTKDTNHSGNGVILGDVQDALIERCSAWGNGADCNFRGGGPVGIWLCEADRSVIRECLSFHNRVGAQSVDGGGFDLDGGCTRCVIEGCLSWRNDGAGYLICQYRGARELRGNIVRDCWSVGDGRAHGYAAVHLWCDPPGSAHDTVVTGCTLVMDPTPQGSSCVRWGTPGDGVRVENSVLLALDGAWLLRGGEQPGCSVAGNRWLATGLARACREDQTPAELPAAAETLAGEWVIPEAVDTPWLKRLAATLHGGASSARTWGAPEKRP